jgi:hypothetical protein
MAPSQGLVATRVISENGKVGHEYAHCQDPGLGPVTVALSIIVAVRTTKSALVLELLGRKSQQMELQGPLQEQEHDGHVEQEMFAREHEKRKKHVLLILSVQRGIHRAGLRF